MLRSALHSLRKEFTPFLKWFPLIKRKEIIISDLLAGLTWAFIVLPQWIAFATIAWLPPEYWLYTAMVTPIIAALFGSSHHLISWPTTAISLVVFSTISQFAVPWSPEFINLTLVLTFLAGVYQLAFWLARLGKIVDFVSHTVVTGFTAGAALLIITSQIKYVLWISIPSGTHFLETWTYIFTHIWNTNPYVFIIWSTTLIIAFVLKKYFPKIPNLLVALIFGSMVAYFIHAETHNITYVAQIPAKLPDFWVFEISFSTFSSLASGAFAVALLGLIEAISISRSISAKSNQIIDANQEFIGQWLSNMVWSFFSCYAGSGSFTRSWVNYSAGAKTPMAGIFAAVFLAIIVLLIAPITSYLPVAAMWWVIMLVWYNLINFTEIEKLFSHSKTESSILLVTFFATLFLELEFAIYFGIFLSLVVFLNRTSTPDMVTYVRNYNTHSGKLEFIGAHKLKKEKILWHKCPQLEIVRIDMSIYFGSVNHIQGQIRNITDGAWVKHILILAKSINFIDMNGMEMLESEQHRLHKIWGWLYISSLKTRVKKELIKWGFIEEFWKENIFEETTEAIKYIYGNHINKEICSKCNNKIFDECRDEASDLETDYRTDSDTPPDHINFFWKFERKVLTILKKEIHVPIPHLPINIPNIPVNIPIKFPKSKKKKNSPNQEK